jgi:hypothetical protein
VSRGNRFSKKLFNFMSGMDMFAEKVQLTYNGKDSFSTLPGIFVSVILLSVIVAFAVYQFYQMVFRLNPQIQALNFIRDLDNEAPFKPYVNSFKSEGEGGFDFAFGSNVNVDPRVATFEVNEV